MGHYWTGVVTPFVLKPLQWPNYSAINTTRGIPRWISHGSYVGPRCVTLIPLRGTRKVYHHKGSDLNVVLRRIQLCADFVSLSAQIYAIKRSSWVYYFTSKADAQLVIPAPCDSNAYDPAMRILNPADLLICQLGGVSPVNWSPAQGWEMSAVWLGLPTCPWLLEGLIV